MLRLFVRSNDHLEVAACDLAGIPARPEGAAWYDLLKPTPEEERFVGESLGIDIPTREEMQDIEPSARLYKEAGAEFMTITAMTRLDTDEPVKTPVTFVLRDNILITVRYADPKPFKLYAMRAAKPGGIILAGGEAVMIGLLEAFIDRLAHVLENASDEIDVISHEVFRTRAGEKQRPQDLQSVIESIGRKGELLTMARESLLSIIRLTSFHQVGGEGKKATAAFRQEVKTLQRDATALADHAAYLSSKVNFLLDATLGLINLEQNQIIKIFTVASVAFLPPTLVASIYGMNFNSMPELHWDFGYPLAIMIMIFSAILPFAYFKRRGWL
ncbi:magnesium transporter CorA family protein [Mesorhizobium sp. BAC0120]|uniref:magnesium transporter CorA family protein n=1 Tax=Mesorhizobium sp. BAC0120 TaxID=3090670 RepID=UPI00298C5DAF|nr:magnesium transporter CorA family protein [Mesorhizobium sp. BAC0120]MDW6024084.1 magnesium transporter CorA family protein [Mesorhizobium sp. BAC0120]